MSGERERAEKMLLAPTPVGTVWASDAKDLARDVLALLLEQQALREEAGVASLHLGFQQGETLKAVRRAEAAEVEVVALRERAEAAESFADSASTHAEDATVRAEAIEERVVALERIEKAARKLDEALSEEYSRFDSDGVYERYFRFRGEEELRTALKEARK